MDQIRLDYTNLMADAVTSDHGILDAELAEVAPRAAQGLQDILARRTEDLRWLDLPYAKEDLQLILDYSAKVKGHFKNVVVLGIGGSALGTQALFTALASPYHNDSPPGDLPRLFVLDTVDPDLVGEWMEHFDPEETLFNVISKSGGTAETMSQFLVFRDALIRKLGEDEHRKHMVITTDAEKGVLREVVERDGYASFVVPDGVGGRFSVLSSVGLLPAALVGLDVKALLQGAADMDQRCKSPELESNPAMTYAAMQWLLQEKHGQPIAVTFSYSNRLKNLGDWYAQLLAESIGKRKGKNGEDVFAGPTPVRAVGVTDQHSQVQLYVEGPYDKWFTLLSVEQADHFVQIPHPGKGLEDLAYLGGRRLGELFQAERDGTRIALTEAKRANCTLVFPKVDAYSVGQYLFLMELSVAIMGELYGVDAFDQPGVEAGKLAAYALMGREGYEERRAQIEAAVPKNPRVVG
jgi:glucose-6-phosphate isomerase